MNLKLASVILLGVCVLGGLLNWQVSENQKLTNENERLSSQLSEQIDINADYEKRINSLHELDTKHTTELTNAKAEIDKLRDDVRSGRKRVYINAECPKPEANTSESGSNEISARLSETTEQDYWRLREMMAENEKQTLYLQNYINTECSANQRVFY
ncbi:lysis protein [Providencia rettgeri]|uniref:lysis protein n=1 Tax=Providencia rettgeri TaxID=587 RepID=UPI001013A4C2|nr:lysis protein [Providencia rettgeri]RXN73726.1 lysis protein [Providencia rettgeri]